MKNVKKMSLEGDIEKYSDLIMGIDLGTTNSAVAIYTPGTVPNLVPVSGSGKKTLESCVRWDGGEKFTVGSQAYHERYKKNVCYSVKRMMGSGAAVTLTLEKGESRVFTPAEISAEILKELKRIAVEFYPGLHRCIITVPAYFNQRQIEDTVEAADLAGLECVQILKEPTSAAYIYSSLGYAQDGSVMIYDLGGGTFDVTVMSFLKKSSIPTKVISTLKRLYKIDIKELGAGDSSLYYCRVLGTYGDTQLGGDDVDVETAKLVLANSNVKDVPREQFEELILRCEQFKKGKAQAQDIEVGGQLFRVSQEDVKSAMRTVFDRTLRILNTIPESQLSGVKTIVLVGGSTKSDYIVEFLNEVFPQMEISRVLDPDAVVALGAGEVAKDLQEGRNAAYQDVLPLAIGILDNETSIDICIPKNTAMPFSVTQVYHTMYDNQEAISVDVYQGLSTMPAECVYLGRLRVEGLPARPAGKLEVKVSFILSAQGRLTVTTNIEGIQEERKLVIDSIFSVTKNKSVMDNEFCQDDFEKSVAEFCRSNPKVADMIYARRDALASGDESKAEELEMSIVEVL